MPHPTPSTLPPRANGHTHAEWLTHLSTIGDRHGYFERIGKQHLALFVQRGDTLVVSFDRATRVFGEAPGGLPIGLGESDDQNWSMLSILSLGETWFRDRDLFDVFDRLAEGGFFESFRYVVFLGLGAMCGHAACAFSSAASGAYILACNPAAALRPDLHGFDKWRLAERRGNFARYGYAPSMLQSAKEAIVLYDPFDAPSATHAAKFRFKQVTRVPLRLAGPDLKHLIQTDAVLIPLLRSLTKGGLAAEQVHAILRPVRRAHGGYLWRLAGLAQEAGRIDRARRVARYAARTTGEPRFSALVADLAASGARRTTGS